MKRFLVMAAYFSLNSIVFGADVTAQYICMNESQSIITSFYVSPSYQTSALSVYTNKGIYLNEANIEALDVKQVDRTLLVTALSTKNTGSRFMQLHLEPINSSDFADGQDVASRHFNTRLLLGDITELKAHDMTCDAFAVTP